VTHEVRHAPAIVDARTEAEFVNGHLPGAVNLPLEQLAARTHELPASHEPLRVMDPNLDRAGRAADFLRKRGHLVELVPFDATQITERGPSATRLWQPNPFLIEALKQIEPRPQNMRALDVACGSGRDAVYLALSGWRVHAIDILADALARAEDLARRNGVEILTEQRDVESDPTLPVGQFDLVVVFRYLYRPLLDALRDAVAEGGYIVYETFHERTRETGRPPRNPEHLLRSGELAQAFSGFELVIVRDGVEREGRYVSSLLGRRSNHL
jgi:tellurite methyltransferase